MEKIIIEPILYNVPFRQILKEDALDLSELPIKGGWGYTKEDAIIIDKNDPIVDPKIPFPGIQIEYAIVPKRIYEELIIFRSKNDKFSGIKWERISQELIHDGGKYYDRLLFKVTAHREKDFLELKEVWDKNSNNPKFNVEKHLKKHQDLLCWYETEYWFDITSFYGKF